MQQNCKLYGMVEIDKLRSVWKARKFAIQVPDSIVQSGLLPSIFDWALLGQLMPAEQASGESLLQQRINDLELLNSLTTPLQRIQILPEMGLDVDVIMGRPSYNVLVQDDGSILVKELPSLHIHVYAAETRAAAGQDCDMLNEVNIMAIEQRKQLAALITHKATLFTRTETMADGSRIGEPEELPDERPKLAHDPNEELGEFEEFLERTCSLSGSRNMLKQQLSRKQQELRQQKQQEEQQQEEQQEQQKEQQEEQQEEQLKQQEEQKEEQQEQPEQQEKQQEQEQQQVKQQDLEPAQHNVMLELEVPPPSESPVQQIDEPVVVETRLRRRQPFWIRFGNWLRQSLPRLN